MKTSIYLAAGALCAVSISAFATDAAHTHWGYEGEANPSRWAELEKDFASCKLSKEQSPIDIETAKAKKAKLPAINFTYGAGSAEMINNGHTIQVNLPSGSAIKIGDGQYQLLQFHFHTPSEEKINGKNYPMVAHFVHKNGDGKLSVVAVLFNEGKENPALKSVFGALPGKEGAITKLATFNPADVLPAKRDYYAFMGSLTTPPCSDGVRWQVLSQAVELSKEQIASFRNLYKMNARPVQPLNGRLVQVSQ